MVRCSALLTMVFMVACSRTPTEPSPTPLTISLQASSWETISDPQPYPLVNQGAALTFDFPSTGSMHYLFTSSPQPSVHGTLVATFTIATTGQAIFNSLDPQSTQCTLPVSVRPFFWANNNGEGPYDRWWSNPRSFTLAAGTGTLTVPLKPEDWSSVNGRFGGADLDTRFAFERALLNVTRLGLTFGGGCSFGHGINVRGGSASFTLTDYRIQ